MRAAIEVQQLAEARPRLASAPMAAAGAAFGHEARFLKREADKAVREREAVIPPGQMIEVADVEALVGPPIEVQDALHLGDRRLPRRRQPAPIVEPDHLIGLVPRPPAAQTPGIDAENVGGLQPCESATQSAHDDFLP